MALLTLVKFCVFDILLSLSLLFPIGISSTAERKQAKAASSSSQFQQVQLEKRIVIKIVDGTQLVATTNRQGAIEFNVPPAKIWQAGEVNWFIPNLTQADIDLKVPDAPTDD